LDDDTPILVSVPSWATTDQYHKIVELALETFGMKAVYVAKEAVLR